MLRAPFLSKGKEKMRNIAIGEDGASVKGFVGCSHSGSSVSDHPSYPANKEKGLNFEGFCGMTKVEFFQVSSHHSFSAFSAFTFSLLWYGFSIPESFCSRSLHFSLSFPISYEKPSVN